jgi:GrpB-like predicted nucleotidyltransferase (UPF0157 family)
VPKKKAGSAMNKGERVILHGVPIGLAHGTVELVPYDDRWPALFQSEAALLHTGLEGQVARIAHIGSTAIRGMDAKPIIDLMVEVPSLRAPSLFFWSLSRYGYALVAEDDVSDRLFYVKLTQGQPTHHLSACEAQSNFWYSHLSFRDRLRADSALATEYAALKRQLSKDYPNDRAEYTRAKEAFISAVLAR